MKVRYILDFTIENEDMELDTQNEGGNGVEVVVSQDNLKIPYLDDELDGVGTQDCMEYVDFDHNTTKKSLFSYQNFQENKRFLQKK